jgi:hypothetical protein
VDNNTTSYYNNPLKNNLYNQNIVMLDLILYVCTQEKAETVSNISKQCKNQQQKK